MITRWIGPETNLDIDPVEWRIGDVGFIVGKTVFRTDKVHFSLQAMPALTNVSLEPRLSGWCGSNNDFCIEAFGVGKVKRVGRGGRFFVETLTGSEQQAALDKMGYPALSGLRYSD